MIAEVDEIGPNADSRPLPVQQDNTVSIFLPSRGGLTINKPGLVWVARFFGVVKKPVFHRFSFLIVSRWLWTILPWAVFLFCFCF